MRFTLLPSFVVSVCVSWCGPWLVIGAVWQLNVLRGSAAEGQSEKISRLGFGFDQRAHDAAATANTAATLQDVPADPDVLHLPKYTVNENRIPLEEHEILTPKGKDAIARKRYLTPMYQKTLGPLSAVATFLNNPLGGWKPNGPEAMAIYEDFENLRRKNQERDLSNLSALADRAKEAETSVAEGKGKGPKKR